MIEFTAGREDVRTTEGNVTRHDLQCVAPTRYSRGCSEGVVLFLALLLLCSQSWAACSTVKAIANARYDCSGITGVNVSCNVSFSLEACLGATCYYTNASPSNYYCVPIDYFAYDNATCNSPTSSKGVEVTFLRCDTQDEADSTYCAMYPDADGCTPQCDSTHWECTTSVEHSQTTIASDNIQCFGGDCYGGVYCEYVSESTTECLNDCGQITTETARVPIRYEGACNPDNLTDDTECTGVRCMSFEKTGAYSLYKLCASREIVNGERKFLPRLLGGGKGTCKNAGYPESNGDSTAFGGGSSPDSASIPESCFTMGIGCPAPDTTNYNDTDNRTPQNNCSCEKLDGMSYISRVICPDGSVTAFYGSCDEWRASANSSSSVPPEPSSSGSENPPTSSGGELVGNWATYSQGEDIKGILGVIAMNTAKEQQINNVNSVNVALDDYTTGNDDVDVPFIRNDSIYDPSYVVDTAGLRQAIFGRVTEQNQILDTLLHPVSKCPCFTFFSGGGSQANISGSHISLPKMEFDFSNFHGFDLCHIISVIVTALASVVAFFIGFAIFKNVSQ